MSVLDLAPLAVAPQGAGEDDVGALVIAGGDAAEVVEPAEQPASLVINLVHAKEGIQARSTRLIGHHDIGWGH
jgi:hypothetical protein